MVHMSDAAVRIQRKHAVRNAFQDGFDMAAPLLQGNVRGAKIAAGSLNLSTAGFQFFSHAVERVHQIADFVGSADFHAVIEPSTRNLLRRFRQRDHGARNQFGEK